MVIYMNVFCNIIKSLEGVTKKILSADVKHIEYKPNVTMNQNELCVANIDFYGEKSGILIMGISSGEIDMVTNYISCKFGFEKNLSPDVLYPEILNMYAGNVLTEIGMSENCYTISPSEHFAKIDSYHTCSDFMIRLELSENFSLSFWFYIIV